MSGISRFDNEVRPASAQLGPDMTSFDMPDSVFTSYVGSTETPTLERPRHPIPPLADARVTGAYAACAVQTAQILGGDLRSLGAEVGLNLTTGLPEYMPVSTYLAFLDAAARQLNEPFFGFKVGQRSRVTDARAYHLLLLACGNLRSLIEQVIRYEVLMHDLGRSELIVEGRVAHYRVHSPWLELPGARHFLDYAAGGAYAQGGWLTAVKMHAFEFSTTLPAPPAGIPVAEYERVLGAPVRFGAEHNQASFPAMLLSLPILGADTSLFTMLKQVAEQRLALFCRGGEARVVAQVRAHLMKQVTLGRTTLPEMATALRLSSRTLQRQLADAGTTFGRLLDEFRREQAQRHLLDSGLALAEVAFLLGYSDQSAFTHAFRAWFGMTPGAWRRDRLGSQPSPLRADGVHAHAAGS